MRGKSDQSTFRRPLHVWCW